MKKSVNSIKVAKPSGSYSQVLKVGDFVYISGQIGINSQLEIPDSLKAQIKIIFDNVSILLSELDMQIVHIVKANVYLKNGEDIKLFDKLYQENFKHPFPARTLAFVDSLSDNDALVEIAFDAIDTTALQIAQDGSEDDCKDCENEDCSKFEN